MLRDVKIIRFVPVRLSDLVLSALITTSRIIEVLKVQILSDKCTQDTVCTLLAKCLIYYNKRALCITGAE